MARCAGNPRRPLPSQRRSAELRCGREGAGPGHPTDEYRIKKGRAAGCFPEGGMSRPSGHGSSTNGRGERGLSQERVGHAGDNPRPTGGNTPQLDFLERRPPGQDPSGGSERSLRSEPQKSDGVARSRAFDKYLRRVLDLLVSIQGSERSLRSCDSGGKKGPSSFGRTALLSFETMSGRQALALAFALAFGLGAGLRAGSAFLPYLWMNCSVSSLASVSVYCFGGDFMK